LYSESLPVTCNVLVIVFTEIRNANKIVVMKCHQARPLGRLIVDGRIIFKMELREMVGRVGLD
jgi:hypothetical protein